jgi:hypothetical protein
LLERSVLERSVPQARGGGSVAETISAYIS